MIPLDINAQWDAGLERMVVTLTQKESGHTYVERLSRREWDQFVLTLDQPVPLRIGGYELLLIGATTETAFTRRAVVDYLKRVDYALRVRGSTDLLPDHLPEV